MGQQEFEPQGQPFDEEIDPLRYPYTWSSQPRQKGIPRDEPPGTSGTRSGQSSSQGDRPSQAQGSRWARPQPQHNDPLVVAAVVALVIFLILVAGWVGIESFFSGAGPYLLGVVWGAIFAFLVFLFLLVSLMLRLVFRAVGQRKRHQGSSLHETTPGPR